MAVLIATSTGHVRQDADLGSCPVSAARQRLRFFVGLQSLGVLLKPWFWPASRLLEYLIV
jgi:hypothetical protein